MHTVQPRLPTPKTKTTSPLPIKIHSLFSFGFVVPLLLILALAASLYVVLAANWPKFSRAEVFYAECAREMLARSNFVTPLYHGQPFLEKPILTYWLILGCFKAFGVSHLVARLPSIAAAVSTIVLTAAGTALLFNRTSGLIAAMFLASSFMFFSFAALCMSDMLLVCFDTASLSFLYAGCRLSRHRQLFWWLASVSIGLAFLTKGPVGVLLPAFSFLLYMTLTKQLQLISLKHFALALLTITVIASPWFIAAWQANGSGSMYYFFVHDNLHRFAASTYDTHRPIWYMIASLFAGFAPWSVFLPIIAWNSLLKWRRGLKTPEAHHELYLWLWIATVVVFFSISQGKTDYYVLPAYPAAAALTGAYLGYWLNARARPAITVGWAMSLCLILVGGISCCFLAPMVGHTQLSQWALLPASLCLAGGLMALCMWKSAYFGAYAVAYTGLCLAVIGFGLQVMTAIGKLQSPVNYTAIVRSSPPATKVGIYQTMESWLDEVTFQTGREPQRLNSIVEVAQFLSSPEPVLAMVPRNRFQQLPYDVLEHIRVIDSRPFMSHCLNPGYIIKCRGQLSDAEPLLLISNQK